ncbi:hypothetical protein K437DRAFT_256187 [Tilletiaria anomala UBC 951]|uniref:Uncharacterized protein n=1 Tax=Tilletiaria anomala (strain ATCC 24038 / CBS 436.72 / UBC 951) TaxID=1037660 RepID=A0A066W6R7_TILAU|nr:uncharacterized protein K437DRAFT_256187 [Tilletiaria anomala UBC 951]KDN46465.1 hypothetical protein K437DRAFT_256187 [Tilletiaria anomala UBC 951]
MRPRALLQYLSCILLLQFYTSGSSFICIWRAFRWGSALAASALLAAIAANERIQLPLDKERLNAAAPQNRQGRSDDERDEHHF